MEATVLKRGEASAAAGRQELSMLEAAMAAKQLYRVRAKRAKHNGELPCRRFAPGGVGKAGVARGVRSANRKASGE